MGYLTKEQRLDLVEKYSTGEFTLTALSGLFDIRIDNIRKMFKKLNIPIHKPKYTKKKYPYNEHYFDIIDTEEKAYFLGLLYADGCNDSNSSRITLGLIEDDIEILKRFMSAVNCAKPLEYSNINSKHKKRKNQYKITLSGRYICQKLAELGCVSRKSLILQFPNNNQVPTHMQQHFIRGMWDGDGSVLLNRGRVSCVLCSTEHVCRSISLIVEKSIGVKGVIRQPKSNKNTYILSYNKKSSYQKFLPWLYNTETISLDRKRIAFEIICKELFS